MSNRRRKWYSDYPVTFVVAGLKYQSVSEELLGTLHTGAPVVFDREPENPKDKAAIKVYAADICLGYVPSHLANRCLARHLDKGRLYWAKIISVDRNRTSVRIKVGVRGLPEVNYKKENSPRNSSEPQRAYSNRDKAHPVIGVRFQKDLSFRDKKFDREKQSCGIYLIWNKDHKGYVGQSKNIGRRWRQHERDLKSGKHSNQALQRDWNLYGPSLFRFDVLESCDEQSLDRLEAHYISRCKSYTCGYNVTEDGQPLHMTTTVLYTPDETSLLMRNAGSSKRPHRMQDYVDRQTSDDSNEIRNQRQSEKSSGCLWYVLAFLLACVFFS